MIENLRVKIVSYSAAGMKSCELDVDDAASLSWKYRCEERR